MTTSRTVDLELGEMAIAMETRVHGSVSMPPLFTNGREAGRREAASALDSEC